MSSKLEIQWSPIRNKFITWGSEICLYEVEQLQDNRSSIKLSNTTGANLLATNSNYPYIKCIDIYPKSESDLLLAIGQGNGRVALSTFGPSIYDGQSLTGRELVPRHPRQCNALSWNPIETNIIAVGLEKHRQDHSVLLWDIMKCPVGNDMNGSSRLAVNTVASAVELARPVAEFGISDSTHSLAWFHMNSKVMAVGMNMKNIKLVDLRDSIKVVNSTLTKSVYGICIDPNDDRHLASFVESQMSVWDTRNFEKPILTLLHTKPLLRIAWCPTKHNLLSSLQRESSVINLYDIQHTVVNNEEVEPSVLERVVVPGSPHNITSYSWHQNDENRFLAIAFSGPIMDYVVFDRITLNSSPHSNFAWTYNRKTLKYLLDSNNALQDISQKIKHRAAQEYGLKNELYKNGELVDDQTLTNVWNWLHLSGKLVEEGIIRGYNSRHPGVKAVLKIDGNTLMSEAITVPWSDAGNTNCCGSARIYRHEDRDKALHLCGSYFDKDSNSLAKHLDQLERNHAYTRAAAVAVFNLKIRTAIDILSRNADSSPIGVNLNVVAMALAGFSDDKNSMWRHFCGSPKAKLSDPYLRAMFAFLTADNYNYDSVLNEDGMLVDDRVAFACMFLPDNKLHDYLRKLTERLMSEGNLDAILLTGNSPDGLKLLQRYLDVSGDIQTTTLIAVRAFPTELASDTVKEWIQNYQNLLDSWQLWNERAKFDIMLSSYRSTDKPPQQVYVSCNFCGKSISAYMQGLGRGRGTYPRIGGTANKLKLSSCPHCRKPLPRCAICLMHMGTTTGCQNGDVDNPKIVEFSSWFTWCQSCRHGGHSLHMIQWFKEHSECPVTACSCRCFAVDTISNTINCT